MLQCCRLGGDGLTERDLHRSAEASTEMVLYKRIEWWLSPIFTGMRFGVLTSGSSVYCDAISLAQHLWCERMDRMTTKIAEKRRNHGTIGFLYGKVRPHIARVTRQMLFDFVWEIIPLPPYSSEFALKDCHLFPSLSNTMQARAFYEDGLKSFRNDHNITAVIQIGSIIVEEIFTTMTSNSKVIGDSTLSEIVKLLKSSYENEIKF
ncbi:hypothetical protein Y032_0129g1472 [Ancylostoma ceylanicum]|uniref:Uncharacterized protein n=1 Tax=Ancylostoma ceylanicum TaxID=53326 RepID=A0A016T6R5_9BILA|nr:hypothetical protein Y032_0129g1472 [Ancylostoma ceylanicum]